MGRKVVLFQEENPKIWEEKRSKCQNWTYILWKRAESFHSFHRVFNIQHRKSTPAVEKNHGLHDSTAPPHSIHNPVENQTPA